MATYIRGEPVKLSECHIPQHHGLEEGVLRCLFFVDHANMGENKVRKREGNCGTLPESNSKFALEK